MNVSLLSNPSHLEAINPVAMGKARAKQTELMRSADPDCNLGDRVMCVQIHGDAVSVGEYIIPMTFHLNQDILIGIHWSRCCDGITKLIQFAPLLFRRISSHCRQQPIGLHYSCTECSIIDILL